VPAEAIPRVRAAASATTGASRARPGGGDVCDRVLRAAEWTDSLRDLVTIILETNLTIRGNRMSIITKKVTSWAAIIAVPALITGFYGMNVPYPGFSSKWGFLTAMVTMVVAMIVLYHAFRRRDWL
jgi:magnesium transporter